MESSWNRAISLPTCSRLQSSSAERIAAIEQSLQRGRVHLLKRNQAAAVVLIQPPSDSTPSLASQISTG
jgi:hypothetical protein